MHYIKGFFSGDTPEWVHDRFVRYGRGSFGGPAVSVKVGRDIKLLASIEYVNALGELIAKNTGEPLNVSGTVFAKREIEATLKDFFATSKPKSSKGLYSAQVSGEVSGDELSGVYEMLSDAFFLLDISSGKQKLRCKKKKLPKPGSKPDDAFCSATLSAGALSSLRDEILFDADDGFAEASVSHEITIEELVRPPGVTDSAKLRTESKRKGKIMRTLTVDGKTKETEAEMLV